MSSIMSKSQIESFLSKYITSDILSLNDKDKIIDSLKSSLSNELSSMDTDLRTVYTSRDMNNIRTYLIDKIKGLTDDWTDFNESDAGMVILELIAGLGDMLGFYLDKQSQECYIGSVKQRKNGMALLSLIGYHPYMTNSCVTTCRFELSSPLEYDLIIPKYTQVSAHYDGSTDLLYATSKTAVIYAGKTSVDVVCMQGEVHKSYVTLSKLADNQKIELLAKDVANNSVTVTINNEDWTQVDDVLAIGDSDLKSYSVYEDKLCNPYILFHNNYKNYITGLSPNSKAEITYLTSLGPDGKVSSGKINTIVTQITDRNGDQISNKLSVTNIDNASGGSERESLDHAKIYAPRKLATVGKAIILKDYEDIANTIPGVSKCIALDWSVDNSSYVSVPYQVQLYIVPTDGGVPSDTFLSVVTSKFTNIMPSSMTVIARSAKYVKVNVSAEVYVTCDESEYYSVKSLITNKIRDYFNPNNFNFGDGVQPSNISTLIENSSTSVDYVKILSPSDLVVTKLNEFPMLDNVDITIKPSYLIKSSNSSLFI